VNCQAVRDRLPEHALGVADRHDVTSIERHLATCAACRKEARDLHRAAGTLAFAPAPASPPDELEDSVVAAVAAASAPSGNVTKLGRRRGRRAAVILVAAALVVAGLGAGSLLARRQGPADPGAQAQQQEEAFRRFRAILESARTADPETTAAVGRLTARSGQNASGAAIAIMSPKGDDQVVIVVNGLRASDLPYDVRMTDQRGHAIHVRWIRHLDSAGGAMVAQLIGRDLSPYVGITVRDAKGRVVLAGSLDQAAPASPAP